MDGKVNVAKVVLLRRWEGQRGKRLDERRKGEFELLRHSKAILRGNRLIKRVVFVIIGFLISSSSLGCTATRLQSKLILNEEYFQIAHSEIQNAKESIYLIAYLFLVYDYPDSYSNRLLDDLIGAGERGIDVHVILDYPKSRYMGREGPKNQKVYEKLKAAGIDVRFDSPDTTTHNKTLVIDRETIILGSHNYTFSGLKHNNEASVLLRDRKKAKKVIEYFEQID